MTRDTGRRQRRSAGAAGGRGPLRRFARTPAVEPLEGRPLLSQFYSGLTDVRPVQSSGGMYTLSVNGPGFERVQPLGHGLFGVTLLGTTQATTLNVSLTRQLPHKAASPLQIGSIRVVSGQLGGVLASGAATLVGSISPLNGSVGTLQFAGLGPNAQISVNGSLGSLTVSGAVDLGPNGRVQVAGDLSQSLSAGSLDLDGGQVNIGHDLSGSLNVGALTLTRGGKLVVGHDVTGGAQVGTLSVNNDGVLAVGHNLAGLTVGQSAQLDSGGQVAVGNDVTGPVSVGEGLNVTNHARLSVGRDLTGGLSVTGDLNLASGGTIAVGRALDALTVQGDLTVAPSGGLVAVGGDLNSLTVNGAFRGQGTSAIDLAVGLNLGSLTVLGGGAGQGGLQGANIAVAKDILGLNVPHGIFNSFITAGVLIDGGNGSGSGGNLGADGPDAILNSEIRAGVEINHLTINGNVRSTFAADPNSAGYRTRIIAGEDRDGNFLSGGLIDNFQITGALIDSVVAASVAPNGGNGSLPTFTYGQAPASPSTATPGDLGFNTYDAPAGTITGGTVGAPIKYPNFSEVSYYNETRTPPDKTTYDTNIDPTIDDFILPGAINPSFASAPLRTTALANQNAVLPLPTESTVLGGVISTVHGDEADFAGIFAADTRGVFVGPLPS